MLSDICADPGEASVILWGHTGHRAAADAMHRHHDKGRACRELGCVDTRVPIMWKEAPVSRDECNRFSEGLIFRCMINGGVMAGQPLSQKFRRNI